MTGSYFQKKIILILALAAFLTVSFFPANSVEAAGAAPTAPATAAPAASPAASPAAPAAAPSLTSKVLNVLTSPSMLIAAPLAATGVGLPAAAAIVGAAAVTSDSSGTGQNDAIWCVSLSSPFVSISGCLARVAFLILQLSSWVLWISAILFNATINYTLNMASFIKDVPIVDVGWTAFRDVTNLLFIFIILYIAINTIIGNEGYGIKKLLGKVIVGAMMINFSLFFTQAMIDASNILALQFYHKIIVSSQGASTAAGKDGTSTNYDAGISAGLVNAMGLQQIFFLGSSDAQGSVSTNSDTANLSSTKLGLNASNLILVGLGGTIFVLITAFVFFAGTIMLLARTVVLIFLMILSPIAFMGNILPSIGKYTGEWWSKLTSNLLFAPVYMMLLYLVINMVTSPNFKKVGGGTGSFADMFSGGTGWIPTVMTFLVLIMLMLGCLMIASKLGVYGSKWAEKTGNGFASSMGAKFSLANFALRTASDIGETRFVKSIASSSAGRAFGGGAVLRRFDSLKDIKIGSGKSIREKDAQEEKDIKKTQELLKDTKQGRWENDDDYKAREKRNQHFADRNVGISSDSSGTLMLDDKGDIIKRKNFGMPRIFGSNSARKAAQKVAGEGREKDIDKAIKKTGEGPVKKLRKQAYEEQNEINRLKASGLDDNNHFVVAATRRRDTYITSMRNANKRNRDLTADGGGGAAAPAATA